MHRRACRRSCRPGDVLRVSADPPWCCARTGYVLRNRRMGVAVCPWFSGRLQPVDRVDCRQNAPFFRVGWGGVGVSGSTRTATSTRRKPRQRAISTGSRRRCWLGRATAPWPDVDVPRRRSTPVMGPLRWCARGRAAAGGMDTCGDGQREALAADPNHPAAEALPCPCRTSRTGFPGGMRYSTDGAI